MPFNVISDRKEGKNFRVGFLPHIFIQSVNYTRKTQSTIKEKVIKGRIIEYGKEI